MRWLVFLLPLPVWAETGAITRVPYEPLARELSQIIDFEDFPSQRSPGILQDDTLVFEGATIGERFAGQVVTPANGFDTLTGDPVPGLAVLPGIPGQNLSVAHIYFQSNQLQGLGAAGYPAREAGGEGAVAIAFEQDQRAVGFRVSAEIRPDTPQPSGRMTVTFHARDGTVIDRHQVALHWGRAGYGFARVGGQADIAGLTVVNQDPGGIAIDDIVFDLLRAGT